MDLLTELAIKYKTDKWGKHHYTPIYYEMFKDKRNVFKNIIEIGSAEGAGIKMFRDFFPNATIYGADIEQKRVDLLKGWERVKGIRCDQVNQNALILLCNKVEGEIDLIIDDGSHKPDDQFFTADQLVPAMKAGGFYIIEDVADDYLFQRIK